MILFWVTPLLGALRNFTKYKYFKFLVFIRSPLLYFFIQMILQTNNIWKILIIERWLMFLYKTALSIYKKDYIIKKEKYIKKYKLKYD